ncbi:hypothetical protein [Bifidobacterium saguini]|nr:hypothetical protein [Bifidobacterium saguini]
MGEMNRMLMCGDRPVMEFEYSRSGGYALRAGTIHDPARVPVGMWVDSKPEPTGESINRWWRSRGIPATRDGLGAVLAMSGIATTADLLDRCLGLSLSDRYWVRPIDRDDLEWSNINFFHNAFDERLGRSLFQGGSSHIGDVNTPDVTSAGDLPKRWIIQPDGTRSLLKAGRTGQEPDNEVIASRVARLLGIGHVEYRIGRAQGRRVSVCDEMLGDDEEIIPGGQIMSLFREGPNAERKEIWLDACERLGADRGIEEGAVDDFLFLDFLLRDTDRHYNNFGLIRNVDTLAVRPAPIFDSGESLWNGMDPDLMDNTDYKAKPFWVDDWGDRENAFWQFDLIRDWDRWDLSLLDEVPGIIHDQLATNRRIAPAVTDAITGTMKERIGMIRERRDAATAPLLANTLRFGDEPSETGRPR